MTHHLIAYSASLDQAAIAPIAAVADPSISVAGNNVQIPDFAPYLLGAYGCGVNLTRAQLQAPSLRRIVNYEVSSLEAAVFPGLIPPSFDLMVNPIPLDVAEQMQALSAEAGAGATRMNVIAFLGDGKVEAITDPIYTVRCTCAQALVAYNWTNGALVFDQVLPVGDYAIVGAAGYSNGLIAFRFVFQGSTPRPGGIGGANTLGNVMFKQRMGGWGVWGIFNSTTPPTVDFFSSAADAAEVVLLDLIKVG